jgi:hypothetical protein
MREGEERRRGRWRGRMEERKDRERGEKKRNEKRRVEGSISTAD